MHSDAALPPLDGLTALLAAADAGSFSGAAEALGITHGSVSRRIAGLEAWLGTALFERHGRGVTLTPAGQRFTTETRTSLGALSRSAQQWRPWRGRQTLRLSAVPSFARLWLIPRLAEIERGDIHIDLLTDHRPNDLGAREADVAIRYGRGNWQGLTARLLLSERLVPAASPALAAQLGPSWRAPDLLRHPLLHDSDTAQWRSWFGTAGLSYHPRWQDRRFEDYDTLLIAAAAGLGIALLRLPIAQSSLDSGALVLLSGSEALDNPAHHYLCTAESDQRAAVAIVAERIMALR
jgi:LysR family glycine cleavage system transcriptional activator